MELNRSLISTIKKWITPPAAAHYSKIRYLRERVFYSLVLVGITMGPFVIGLSLMGSIEENSGLSSVGLIVSYLCFWALFLFRSLPYCIRLSIFVAAIYVVGLEALLITGRTGTGLTWLFLFPLATVILAEFRWALLALLINALTLFGYHWIILPLFPDPSLVSHLTFETLYVPINYVLLNVIATLSVSHIVRGLQDALIANQHMISKLESNNVQLTRANQQLESERDARQVAQTTLRKTKKALKENELRFWELVNYLPLGYFLMDDTLNVRFLNSKLKDDYDVGEEVQNESFESGLLQAFSLLDQDRVLDKLSQTILGNDSDWEVFSIYDHHHRDVPVEIHLTLIRQNNTVIGVQGLIVDITDRLEKEQMRLAKDVAERANQAISDWLSFIAHEIRTPMGVPMNFSKLGIDKLQKMKAASLNQKEGCLVETNIGDKLESLSGYFTRILSSSSRLNKLLDDLLDLSRLESGQMSFDFKAVNVFNIVRDINFEYEATLKTSQLSLNIVAPEIDTVIECDSFRVSQVIHNLLSNAIKFTPEKRSITISFHPDQIKLGRRETDPLTEGIRISIIDEGVGIPEDQLSFIFDKYKQSRKSKPGEGTGLGLPICKEIIAAHRGIITVDSQDEKGSAFHVVLPIQQTPVD